MQDLIDRITIEFPGPLTLEQAEDLLEYIARELPANINYDPSQFRNFFHNPQTGKLEKQEGTARIVGSIINLKSAMGFNHFLTIPSERFCGAIEGLRFSLIPDFDLKDYEEEVVHLWDSVREHVHGYFDGH